MEGDEGTSLVSLRELRALVNFEIVWRPVRGKRRDGRLEFCAVISLFAAIAAIFWRQHKLLLGGVEITFRPAVVAAVFQHQHALRGKLRTLLRRVEFRPILVQLITAVFGDIKAPCGVKVKTFAVAYASGVPFL